MVHESRCLDVADMGQRQMVIMIRGGTSPLRVEWGFGEDGR